MFATFLGEMGPILVNMASFPTVIYTVLLGVCVVFWLIAMLGLIELEIIDFDMDMDMDLDIHGLEVDAADLNIDATEAGEGLGFIPGLLFRFRLVGVPLTVSLTILMLTGWVLCYYAVHFLYPLIPAVIPSALAGVPIFFMTLYLAAKITAKIINPLKPFFDNGDQHADKKILGQTVTVRTSRVDADFGEAVFEDGGAGLILKVRAKEGTRFAKGDRVIILQRLDDNNIYQVISEDEFMHALTDGHEEQEYEIEKKEVIATEFK